MNNTHLVLQLGSKVLADQWPAWTIERLLIHPRDAMRLCREVRGEMGSASHVRDDEILGLLLNARKQGRLRLGELVQP